MLERINSTLNEVIKATLNKTKEEVEAELYAWFFTNNEKGIYLQDATGDTPLLTAVKSHNYHAMVWLLTESSHPGHRVEFGVRDNDNRMAVDYVLNILNYAKGDSKYFAERFTKLKIFFEALPVEDFQYIFGKIEKYDLFEKLFRVLEEKSSNQKDIPFVYAIPYVLKIIKKDDLKVFQRIFCINFYDGKDNYGYRPSVYIFGYQKNYMNEFLNYAISEGKTAIADFIILNASKHSKKDAKENYYHRVKRSDGIKHNFPWENYRYAAITSYLNKRITLEECKKYLSQSPQGYLYASHSLNEELTIILENKNLALLQYFILIEKRSVDSVINHKSLLEIACAKGCPGIVEFLLKNKAKYDVKKLSLDPHAPIMRVAINANDLATVKVLLNYNVPLDNKTVKDLIAESKPGENQDAAVARLVNFLQTYHLITESNLAKYDIRVKAGDCYQKLTDADKNDLYILLKNKNVSDTTWSEIFGAIPASLVTSFTQDTETEITEPHFHVAELPEEKSKPTPAEPEPVYPPALMRKPEEILNLELVKIPEEATNNVVEESPRKQNPESKQIAVNKPEPQKVVENKAVVIPQASVVADQKEGEPSNVNDPEPGSTQRPLLNPFNLFYRNSHIPVLDQNYLDLQNLYALSQKTHLFRSNPELQLQVMQMVLNELEQYQDPTKINIPR